MEGAALAAERSHERAMLVAHHGAAWTGAAYVGKLKAFAHYMPKKTQVPQSGEAMLRTLEALKDMGAPMTIQQLN